MIRPEDELRLRIEAPGPAPPTRAACEAAIRLGLAVGDPDGPVAGRVDVPLGPGSVVLVRGPSGGGKTTLVRAIAAGCRARGWRVIDPARVRIPERPCVGLFGPSIEAGMRELAGAGLADARCFVRRPHELSSGQRARLGIAVALHRARTAGGCGPVVVVCDEFGSGLDVVTARALAVLVRRGMSAMDRRVRLVAATAREDVEAPLDPGAVLVCPHPARVDRRSPCAREDPVDAIGVEPGGRRDYAALAHHHYRPGAPATMTSVLRAVCGQTGDLAGVLVVSRPTLTAAWRRVAWGSRYDGARLTDRAVRINRELRCISRVIVDPRWRGLGIARLLVRRYLSAPETACTEAVAAMGSVCGFFEAGGMTAYRTPPDQRTARLADAVEHAGVASWRLAVPPEALDRAIAGTSRGFIIREVARWRRCPARTLADSPRVLGRAFGDACRAITARPVAYAHAIGQGRTNHGAGGVQETVPCVTQEHRSICRRVPQTRQRRDRCRIP